MPLDKITEEYNSSNLFWRDFSFLPNNPYVVKTDMHSFRCLFVHLVRRDDFPKHDYPISYGYMASILRMNGAIAEILVQDIDVYESESFSRFDLICFFPMVALLSQIMDFVSKIKSDYPGTKICLFNSEQHQHEMLLCSPKAVDFAQIIMERNKCVDFILVGEAESSFLKLCEKLVLENNNLNDIPLCLYREFGEIEVSLEKARPVDFKYLPYPSRDFLEKSISSKGINAISPRIQSSRGCVSPCLYCAESIINIPKWGRKKPWIGRDITQFVDEIEMLSTYYKAIFFNIIDSSFEDPGLKGLERMRIFCDEIISRNIMASFKIHLRVETIDKLSDEILQKMKGAGIDILVIGVESGVERELNSYKKITTVKKNIDNIHRLDKFGRFFNLLGHMMFSPCLKLEDLIQKVEFLKKLRRGWDYLNMSNNVLTFRGTAFHDYINSNGLALDCDELSGIIPYRYKDDRVKYVANEMGNLRIKCPFVVSLNNLLYDAQNIAARFFNKINSRLWGKEADFKQFKNELSKILFDVQEVYCQYTIDLIDLADSKWSLHKANLIYEKHIPKFFEGALNKTKKVVDYFIDSCEKDGLKTNKLYLKTWMSLINTQINTSEGRVN